jgi:hypothetical protein
MNLFPIDFVSIYITAQLCKNKDEISGLRTKSNRAKYRNGVEIEREQNKLTPKLAGEIIAKLNKDDNNNNNNEGVSTVIFA